jgi:GT2 family glycosyltransferase/glycosyltransferase involved in cell wall biosynthesis
VLRGHLPSRHALGDRIARDAALLATQAHSILRLEAEAAEVHRSHEAVKQSLTHDRAVLSVAYSQQLQEAARLEAELRNFAAAHEKTVAGYEAELSRERAAADRLSAALATTHQSRSWRVTAPLRAVMRLPGRIERRLARTQIQFSTAWNILRHEGLLALARRVQQRLAPPAPLQAAAVVYQTESTVAPLHLVTSATPSVSIVIPVYGQHLLTYSLLKSIALHDAGTHDFEVLIADDCSPEPAATALAAVQGIQIVRHAQNLGFLRNCNAAIQQARGATIVLLNNDTQVTAGWLSALLAGFDALPDVAVVGAKLIYPNGRLQEAGGIVWQDGSAWNYGRNDDASLPQYNYLREVDYCSGAALAFAKATFLDTGAFDEHYLPAYCEDTDLCLRMKSLGKKVVYQPACTIVHFEGQSHGTDDSTGIKAYQADNLKKLGARWQKLLLNHRPNAVLPHLEKDRGVTRRVLFVDAVMLRPDHDSGSLRTAHLLAVMRRMGCHVTFVAENLEYVQPYVADLQAAGVEVLYPPQFTSVRQIVQKRGREFDTIFLARYYIANPLVDVVREFAPQAKLVLDTVDLHFLRTQRQLALEGKPSDSPIAQEVYKEEMAAIRAADAVIVVSPVEVEVLAKHLPKKPVHVLSNIHELGREGKAYAEREGIYFVGGFRHPPNIDAVEWYAREIHPLVKARLPQVPVYIIGSHAPESLRRLEDGLIRVLGFVPDMSQYLAGCRLSIAPLRYGAGVKGKINQAMAYGVPVVGTPCAVEGMYLTAGQEVLVGADAASFAAEVVRAYTDSALWQQLAKAGRSNIEQHFSKAAAEAALKRILQ